MNVQTNNRTEREVLRDRGMLRGWDDFVGGPPERWTVGMIARLKVNPLDVGTIVAVDPKRGPLGCVWISPGAPGGNDARIHLAGAVEVWTGCPDPGCPNGTATYHGAVAHCTPESTARTHGVRPAIAVAPLRGGELVAVTDAVPADIHRVNWAAMLEIDALLGNVTLPRDKSIADTLKRVIAERDETGRLVRDLVRDLREADFPRETLAKAADRRLEKIRGALPGGAFIDWKQSHGKLWKQLDELWTLCKDANAAHKLGVKVPNGTPIGDFCITIIRGLSAEAQHANALRNRVTELEAALAGAQETERQLREEIAEMGASAGEKAGMVFEATGRLGKVLDDMLHLFATHPLPNAADLTLVQQFEAIVPKLAPRADLDSLRKTVERFETAAWKVMESSASRAPLPPVERFEEMVKQGAIIAKTEWTHADTVELQKLRGAIVGGSKSAFGIAVAMNEPPERAHYVLLQHLVDAAHRHNQYESIAKDITSWFRRPLMDGAPVLEKLGALVRHKQLMPTIGRPEVIAFAMAMEAKLQKNDHKGGWDGMTPRKLLQRLKQETRELDRLLPARRKSPGTRADVLGEAADVANFAMMVADVCGALDLEPLEQPR